MRTVAIGVSAPSPFAGTYTPSPFAGTYTPSPFALVHPPLIKHYEGSLRLYYGSLRRFKALLHPPLIKHYEASMKALSRHY